MSLSPNEHVFVLQPITKQNISDSINVLIAKILSYSNANAKSNGDVQKQPMTATKKDYQQT